MVVAEDRDGLILSCIDKKGSKEATKGNLSDGFPLDSFQSTRASALDPENVTVIFVSPVITRVNIYTRG